MDKMPVLDNLQTHRDSNQSIKDIPNSPRGKETHVIHMKAQNSPKG